MNDQRFIELLNLYVDHQLTSAEAAELEHEIARDPARRRTYNQYCRIQKACVALLEKQRAHAPLPPKLARALAEAENKISLPEAARETARRLRHWWAAAGALTAAAAALIIAPRVLVTQNNPAPLTAAPTLASAAQPTPVAITPHPAPLQDEVIDPRTVVAYTDENNITTYHLIPARLASRNRALAPQRPTLQMPAIALDPALQWLNDDTLTPVAMETAAPLPFTPRPALPRNSFSPQAQPTTYGDAQVEMTAFQFQK